MSASDDLHQVSVHVGGAHASNSFSEMNLIDCIITTISDKERRENSGGSHPAAFRW